MKISRLASILGFALAALSPLANAQLITRTFDVTGVSNGVVTRFSIWIDAGTNTLTVDIDNARPLTSGSNTQVGTITGFGFNTPWTIGNQAGDNPGTVAVAAKWTQKNSGHYGVPTAFPTTSSGIKNADDFWSEKTPYNLAPSSFNNDYGVSAQTPNIGIEYGEKATFVFTFQDITVADFAGFLNNNATTANKYDFSVRWQEVGTKSDYGRHGDECADGSDKGGFDVPFFQEGDLPPTPEPSTYGLMGAGALLGLVAHRRMKAKKARAA
jgi:hypothetical protein